MRVWSFGWLGPNLKAAETGHTDAVTTVAFSPTGKRLATGGQDRTVLLWDGLTPLADMAVPLTGHGGNVKLVRFLPDGRRLVVVTDAGRVGVWDASTGMPLGEGQLDHRMASCAGVVGGRDAAGGRVHGRPGGGVPAGPPGRLGRGRGVAAAAGDGHRGVRLFGCAAASARPFRTPRPAG